MRKIKYLCISILIFMISCEVQKEGTNEQDVELSGQVPENQKEVEAVQSAINHLWEALSKQDIDDFKQYCSDDWSYYSARGTIFTSDSLISKHMGNIKNFQLASSDVKVNISGTTAWVTYKAAMMGEVKEKEWKGGFLITNILKKENGKWIMLHLHESQFK